MEAYIITLKNNNLSTNAANICAKSCRDHNIIPYFWEGFDGTGNELKTPKHLKGQAHVMFPSINNTKMTLAQIGCFMSHYSLWCWCIFKKHPIIILEHDALIIKEYNNHKYPNIINYLGINEQLDNPNIPPYVSIEGYNHKFIRTMGAYSIDPIMAKNLVSYVIKEGITKPTDVTLRLDYFSIVQDDIYAIRQNISSVIGDREMFQEPMWKE